MYRQLSACQCVFGEHSPGSQALRCLCPDRPRRRRWEERAALRDSGEWSCWGRSSGCRSLHAAWPPYPWRRTVTTATTACAPAWWTERARNAALRPRLRWRAGQNWKRVRRRLCFSEPVSLTHHWQPAQLHHTRWTKRQCSLTSSHAIISFFIACRICNGPVVDSDMFLFATQCTIFSTTSALWMECN